MRTDKSIPTNEKETLDYMDDSADRLDEQRLSGLQEERNTQLIKEQILQREKKRLAEKHGSTHPEVQEADSRITYNQQMYPGLDNEIDKASVKTEPLPGNAWRVQGRVFDQNSQPVKGVTVFLSDQNKRWIDILGSSCTTELGYYSLTADEIVLDKIEKGQPIYLTVSDKNKTILYFAKAPVFVAKGLIDHQDIYLKNEDCVPPPATNNREEKLSPDTWVVRGTVTDENNQGLNGLTISLYDKDLLFDDVLGTTLTNEKGDFEIIYRYEAFEFLFEKRPDLYLKVLDDSGKELYTSENTVRPGAGRAEEFMIKIDFNKKP